MLSLSRKIMILCVGALGVLTACGTIKDVYQQGHNFIFDKDVNLLEKNYAAADYLLQQAGNRLPKHDLMKAEPLVNRDAPQLSAPLSKVIVEQVGQRFIQLGYYVDLSAVAAEHDQSFEQPTQGTPSDVLGGSYIKTEDGYQIDLRITDVRTQRVDSSFSYLLPFNETSRTLATPELTIEVVPATP